MSDFEGSPQPAEVCFDPAYWQPTTDRQLSPYATRVASLDVARRAAAALAAVAVPALSGELHGPLAPEGTPFDPVDPDLARHSPYNFQGAVVLFDVEQIGPLPQNVHRRRNEPIDHLDISPRTFLRESMHRFGSLTMAVSYLNQDSRYQRYMGFGFIGRTRGTPVTYVAQSISPSEDGQSHEVQGVRSVTLGSRGVVNMVEVLSGPDQPFKARRLRSLELLASGEPAHATDTAPGWTPGLSPIPNQ